MSAAKDERQSTETLSFRCWREWCRLTRGAVVKQRRDEFADNRKCAFTLAEVLITLGVIGVVAALTLPTLITKYQKKLVAKRLAHFSSVMQQGARLRDAQIIDGTFVELEPAEVKAKDPDDMLKFVERYWKPFVKFSKIEKMQKGVLASLPNGSGAYFIRTNHISNVDSVAAYSYILFCPEYKDCKTIDGVVPNVQGAFPISDITNAVDCRRTRFLFVTDGRPHAVNVKHLSREELLAQCVSNPNNCGALIERDGWEIKDDYPW